MRRLSDTRPYVAATMRSKRCIAADKIYANRNTLTGSIGVIISTYNYSELAKKVGVQDVTFKSGSNKDLLNPMRPITSGEQVIMQTLVNESYSYFVDVVAKGRKMDRQRVLELADGRIYSGMQAKTLGTPFEPAADFSNLMRGDLLFWPDHVAIARDHATLIHANAYHMAVAIEPLTETIARIRAVGSVAQGSVSRHGAPVLIQALNLDM